MPITIWNAENRLTTVRPLAPYQAGDVLVSNAYDYLGRRFEKRVQQWDGSQWSVVADRLFVYDGWNLLLELNGMSGDAVDTNYTWGLDLSGQAGNAGPGGLHGAGGVGGLLAIYDPSTSDGFVYFHDANGNVGQLLAANGVIAAHYEYDPYGGETVAVGAMLSNNPFRFSTKYFDAEIDYPGNDGDGLYYYGYRFYSPRLGRILKRDPIGEPGFMLVQSVAESTILPREPFGGPGPAYSVATAGSYFLPRDVDEVQPYQFVYNSPTNGYDPLGDAALGLVWLEMLEDPTTQPTTRPTTQPSPWSNDPDCCKTKQYDKWGWVECCKGAPTICLGKLGLKYVLPVQRCLLSHEGGHKSELPKDYCKCKKDGFAVGSDFNNADRQASECKAFRAEKACLQSVNCKDMPTYKQRKLCSAQRANRLGYINRYLKKSCKRRKP